jgi:hypothetical protein
MKKIRKMMIEKQNFYIVENIATIDPKALSDGVKIIQIDTINIFMTFEGLDGPYNSIQELKKKSGIFKKLVSSDPQRVQKILDKNNIVKTSHLVFTEVNKTFSFKFTKLIEHAVRGDVKKNLLNGIHFFEPSRMKIVDLIWNEDINKVWKAEVEVFVPERFSWYPKTSSFFPVYWNHSQLFAECDYALKNMIKSKQDNHAYYSNTLTGIPVKIIIKDNDVKSIFPIHEKEYSILPIDR